MTNLKTTIDYLRYLVNRYGHLALPLSASILSFVSTYILFGPVLNRSGDNIYHLMNEYAMAHGAAAGDSLFGPLGLEMGQPVLRFYQSLFYLFNVSVHLITGIDLRTVHNVTLCLCFGLSPFSLYYFMRKLRLNRWTAGLASYLSFISVAAFGNSFEAFFQAGIVTQSMGGLFFPWFMGIFIGMLRGENSPVSASVLFALAFLSHAIMAVYATFTGALYFFMSETDVRSNIKKMIIFAGIGMALVSFWVIPFIHLNTTMRPVPDPIFRGSGVHWYTSVSTAELIAVAKEGYMLDDARAEGNQRNETEKLMDKINIIGSLSHRPPIFTYLTAWGLLCSLFLLRRLSARFLLGGFAFSIMLFAGPDDFRWTAYLPFMDKVQAFRCTYLYEIFAFGLSALGIECILAPIFTFGKKRKRNFSKIITLLVWLAGAATVLGWGGAEIVKLGQTHLVVREPNILNMDLDALQNVPDKGYPFKVDVRTGGRPKIRHAWFAMNGFMPYCTHWKGTGPEITFKLCSFLGDPKTGGAFYAMSGVRWFTGWGPTINKIKDAKDEDQLPIMYEVPVGKDRNGRDNSSRVTLDSGFERFLNPYLGSPVPVVCNDKQWLWLTVAWMQRYRNKLWSENMPMIMRVKGGAVSDSGLLDRARALFYLDPTDFSTDKDALAAFSRAGGIVITPVALDGINATQLGLNDDPFSALPRSINSAISNMGIHERQELDPALDVANIKRNSTNSHSVQRYSFDVENIRDIVVVLPLENYPGWHATVDGKPSRVFSTGPDLIGIHLQKGVHRVNFQWKMPLLDQLTIICSLLGLLMVIAIWGFRVWRCTRDERYRPVL